jgi:hypothetical protein
VAKTEQKNSGGAVIYLNEKELKQRGSLGASVVLAHEALRDGAKTDDATQKSETDKAVMNHLGMESALAQTYGFSALGRVDQAELTSYWKALSEGNAAAIQEICNSYESSEDFWKLKMNNGKLLAQWDKTNDITLPNGDVIKNKTPYTSMSKTALALGLFGNTDSANAIAAAFSNGGYHTNEAGEWVDANGNDPGTDFSVDISNMFSNAYSGKGYSREVASWLENGARFSSKAETYEMAKASTDLFFVLNKSRTEMDLARLVVKNDQGGMDYKATKKAWENKSDWLNSNPIGSIASTFFSSPLNGEGSIYNQRLNSLFGSMTAFYSASDSLLPDRPSSYVTGAVGNAVDGYLFHTDIDVIANHDNVSMLFPGIPSSYGFQDCFGNRLSINPQIYFEGKSLNAGFTVEYNHLSGLYPGRNLGQAYGATQEIAVSGNTYRAGQSISAHLDLDFRQSTSLPRNALFGSLDMGPHEYGWNGVQQANTYYYNPTNWIIPTSDNMTIDKYHTETYAHDTLGWCLRPSDYSYDYVNVNNYTKKNWWTTKVREHDPVGGEKTYGNK